MKSKLLKTIAATSLLALSFGQAHAGETMDDITKTGELKVCFDAGYVPFEMKAKSGQYIGFDLDLGKVMAKQMGVKFVPVNTAWDGIIPSLVTNKCHMIIAGMTITAERNMRVNFAEPYVIIGQSILLNPKLEGKVTSYKDLDDPKYTIASKLGTTGENAVKKYIKKAQYHAFETEVDAVMEVVNGKADAMVYDMPFVAITASQKEGKVVPLLEPFTYEPLGIALRQGDPDILNFVNNFLRQVKGDGTYDRLYNKWFKSDAWLSQVQ